MKPNHRKLAAGLAVLMFSVLACNLPGAAAPTPFVFPTPNATLTAIFNPTFAVLPTSSFSTAAPNPNDAGIPTTKFPTSTLSPSTTATLSPTTAVPPTVTTAPTKTPISYAGPAARTGMSIAANYMQHEPAIDGNFDEWNLERYPVMNVVYGASNWSGEADLSGNIMVGWDENNLYIAGRVKDDTYAQNATGENIFQGDSVEVLLDTNVPADYYLNSLSQDDYQLGISPGTPTLNTNPEAYLWYPSALAGTRTKVKASAVAVDGGYRLEMKIPWNTFGVIPAKGEHFGFAFSISDNDKPGKNIQQTVVSNIIPRVFTDPTTWGDLKLIGQAEGTAPTSTTPLTRTGTSITATYLSAPALIDANLDQWTLTEYPINHVVYGSEKWAGATDLSGSVMAGWDQNNLYLGVRVMDDHYVQNMTGENIFLGDSLELLLDNNLADDFYTQYLSADDYQLGISPGKGSPGNAPSAYLWYPKNISGSKSQVLIASKATSDGYIVEAAIPWSVLGVTPANGQHYGFVFSISDNDNASHDVQQKMVSTNGTRVLTDPTTWGDLTLAKP